MGVGKDSGVVAASESHAGILSPHGRNKQKAEFSSFLNL